MSEVLYRKYRARTFAELLGQEHIVSVLKQAVISGKIAHAYLFSGPRGTGKTSTARIFAKAINCLHPKNGEPCNKCARCNAINEGSYLDLIEIDAASNRGIEEIRDLKEKVNFLPAEASYKVYIIDEVHMLTPEAFNALLKTLEEPPSQVVFILATTELHKIPLTILSRSQRFDFTLADSEQLSAKLGMIVEAEGYKIDDDALNLVVEAGQGSFRDAETVLEKILTATEDNKKKEKITKEVVEQIMQYASLGEIEKLFKAIVGKNSTQVFEIIKKLDKKGTNVPYVLKELLGLSRVALENAIAGNGTISLSRITEVIKELANAYADIRFAVMPILVLEVACVKLCGIETTVEEAFTVKTQEAEVKPSNTKKQKEVVQVEDSEQESGKQVSLEDVKENWNALLEASKKYNHHLVAILASLNVVDVKGNKIMVEVPFTFHKSRLEEVRSQNVMKEITKNIFDRSFTLEVSINKDLAKTEEQVVEEDSNANLVESVFSDTI